MATTSSLQQRAPTFLLKMMTPDRIFLDTEIEQLTIRTREGELTILPNHTPLVSLLLPGEMQYVQSGNAESIAVAGGVLRVYENTVEILADAAEHPEQIDIESLERQAEELAKKIQVSAEQDLSHISLLQQQLEFHFTQIELAKKWKNTIHQ